MCSVCSVSINFTNLTLNYQFDSAGIECGEIESRPLVRFNPYSSVTRTCVERFQSYLVKIEFNPIM